MIYLSKPSMITALGDNATTMALLRENKCGIELKECGSKDFMLGSVKRLAPLPKDLDEKFATRTNMLLYNALLPHMDIIKKIQHLTDNSMFVSIGTTNSGVEENYNDFKNGVLSKSTTHKAALSNGADFIAKILDLKVPTLGISTACTSGSKALIAAARAIEANLYDAAICGGADGLSTLSIYGFDSLKILSSTQSIPFDMNRDGINIGEGAAIFIMLSERLYKVLAADFPLVLKGYASNNDAFHITKPSECFSMQRCLLQDVLNMANLLPQEIDYINLHGTGSEANDMMEGSVINEIFGETTPCGSTKMLLGHTLGAAGAIEAAICGNLIIDSMTYKSTTLPPHKIGQYDKKIPKINLVGTEQVTLQNALSLSFAFGGDNSALILGAANV